jgi:putative Mg2+ transporter-C (MgtC) family protein
VAVNTVLNEFNQLTPDVPQLVRVTLRLLAALFIGTAIGLQRELTHKPAGLRTHMLVGLGTALFIVSAAEAGMHLDSLSRIVQGLATGIGFLGGGAILKLTSEREIHGLTTAAGIWMTAAASAAAGLGQIGVALIGTLFGLLVLVVFRKLEKDLDQLAKKDTEVHPHSDPDPKDVA